MSWKKSILLLYSSNSKRHFVKIWYVLPTLSLHSTNSTTQTTITCRGTEFIILTQTFQAYFWKKIKKRVRTLDTCIIKYEKLQLFRIEIFCLNTLLEKKNNYDWCMEIMVVLMCAFMLNALLLLKVRIVIFAPTFFSIFMLNGTYHKHFTLTF